MPRYRVTAPGYAQSQLWSVGEVVQSDEEMECSWLAPMEDEPVAAEPESVESETEGPEEVDGAEYSGSGWYSIPVGNTGDSIKVRGAQRAREEVAAQRGRTEKDISTSPEGV